MTIPNHIKTRLSKERPMTTVTLRVPEDVVSSLQEMAALKGLADYHSLLKWYISNGLRQDEERYLFGQRARFIAALKKHGVPAAVIDAAVLETNIEPFE
ncbi:hypothetical protein [Thiospirillum jenense]|uniref:CopG family transcriptional regulator n=1 Tax=Thiospirillum jenense TaxID=1653858 RepID=A0A839HEX5_9GAMM|nr:hypothetical protein [Thiospirillum jenense]MBB1125579.1 hypothetical protein [Thiospirillum jenense]